MGSERIARRRTADRETTTVEHIAVPARRRAAVSIPVGSVHDPAEADADRLADRALAISSDYGAHRPAVSSGGVQRRASADVDGLEVDAAELDRAGGGRSLDAATRGKLEPGFGADLSGVRVHTDARSAAIADQIHARAFTRGSDIYFASGEYRPGTREGEHVLAHELAHTVQQGEPAIQRFPATWSTSPVPWKPLTASVYRPGEGASGGVYILSSNQQNPDVPKVVVKPVSGTNGLGLRESGDQLQFSDVALAKLLGLKSPVSKVVRKGGSEFDDLVAICSTKQPQNPDGTKPSLADCESFVVMSEVPNAMSVASLADKAASGDQKAGHDLIGTLLDSVFLADLGKLCIGDLMLGNPDRMVLGAMNLSNVMISMQNGRGTLAAIDTTAYIPKAPKPSELIQSFGGDSIKTVIDEGPGKRLDGFFEVLVARMKSGTKQTTDDVAPAWQMIERAYAANRRSAVASFEYGWNDGLITAFELSGDTDQIDDMTDGYGDPDVSSAGLKARIHYLGERAWGKSHNESLGRAIAQTAANWASTVDRARVAPPVDELSLTSATVPAGKSLKADVVPMPKLPTGKNLRRVTKANPHPLDPKDYQSLALFPGRVATAKGQIDAQVTATKKRRRGVFGSKEEIEPRNRSVVSHYVVHAMAMGAGAARLSDASNYNYRTSQEVAFTSGGDFQGGEAAPVQSLMRYLAVSASMLDSHLGAYRAEVKQAEAVIPKTTYHDRVDLADALAAVSSYLDQADKALRDTKKLDLQRVAQSLKVR